MGMFILEFEWIATHEQYFSFEYSQIKKPTSFSEAGFYYFLLRVLEHF